MSNTEILIFLVIFAWLIALTMHTRVENLFNKFKDLEKIRSSRYMEAMFGSKVTKDKDE